MRLISKILLAALAGIIVLGCLAYLGLMQGWIFPSHSKAEITALTEPYDTWVFPDGEGPFPLVIFAHGCGGRTPHHDDWAAVLAKAGFASLITDSFTGRGLHSQDGINSVCGGRQLLGPERAADLYVALDRAQSNPKVDPARIGFLGFSHGSWTVIELLGTVPPYGIDAPIERDGKALDLASIKASALLYPYCGFGAALNGVTHRAPVLFELAGEDEITDHTQCLALSQDFAAQGVPLLMHVAPGAWHAYDVPEWTFAGPNAHYRADLRATLENRVVAFFRANLKP